MSKLAQAAQAVVEAWDAPSTSIYEHHASVAIAIAALRDATPEGIDVEALAAIEHEQWMTWARSVLSADDVTIGPDRLARWQSYMVPYADLSEPVKEHDRVWARQVADVVARQREAAQ